MTGKRPVWRGYDPTATKAISRIYRQEEWKKRQEVLHQVRGGKSNERIRRDGGDHSRGDHDHHS